MDPKLSKFLIDMDADSITVRRSLNSYHAPGHATFAASKALPFFISHYGKFTHRVRSAITIVRRGVISHVAYQFWCGNSGCSSKGDAIPFVHDGKPVCHHCEMKALGHGLPSSSALTGRMRISISSINSSTPPAIPPPPPMKPEGPEVKE